MNSPSDLARRGNAWAVSGPASDGVHGFIPSSVGDSALMRSIDQAIRSLKHAAALVALASAPALAQNSPAVLPVSPPGSIQPTGTWGLASLDKATSTLYIAGMRGIDPTTNKLVDGAEARIRQAFLNMQHIAESQGATLEDCLRIVVYTTDMYRYRPLANKVQQELWSSGPYPPRTIIEVHRLNDDDILEVEGTFHVPGNK